MAIAAPGLAYASERLVRTAFPKLTITPPAPGIRFERDVAVSMRDGTRLRLNLFRHDADGKFPTIMSAHPYGKDAFPRRTPVGYLPRYLPPARYRFMRQPRAIRFSAWPPIRAIGFSVGPRPPRALVLEAQPVLRDVPFHVRAEPARLRRPALRRRARRLSARASHGMGIGPRFTG